MDELEKELQAEIDKLNTVYDFGRDDTWGRELKLDTALKNLKLIDLKLSVLNGVVDNEEVKELKELRKKIILETELI